MLIYWSGTHFLCLVCFHFIQWFSVFQMPSDNLSRLGGSWLLSIKGGHTLAWIYLFYRVLRKHWSVSLIMTVTACVGWEIGLSSSAMNFSLHDCRTWVQSSLSKKNFFSLWFWGADTKIWHLLLMPQIARGKKVVLANTIVAVLKICDTTLSTVWLVICRNKKYINEIHQQKA